MRRRPRPPDPDEVAAQVERVAALIAAGATQAAAWRYLAGASSGPTEAVARGAAEAASLGRPLAAGFAEADPAWRRVGAAVGLAAETGAPVARVLRNAAGSARSAAEVHRAVAAAVAGPAASARLMLLLPPASALLGWAFGFDVPGVLLGSLGGALLLVAGLALLAVAAAWSRRLVARASRTSWTTGLDLELTATAVRAGLAAPAAQRLAAEAIALAGLPGGEEAAADEVVRFALDAGLPVVALLEAEAARAHRVALAEARVRATVLGVRLLVPLGALVLPAFLLLGAAPIGIAVLRSTTLPL